MSFHMKQELPKITDKTLLKRALATLGYAISEHDQPVAVRAYGREILATRCELVLLRENTGLGADIGLHKEQDGSFTIASDSFAIKNLPKIMADLKRTYEEEKAIARAHAMGFRVASRGKWIQRGEEQFLQIRVAR